MQAIPSENGSTLAASMEQTTLTPAKCFVRDLVAGSPFRFDYHDTVALNPQIGQYRVYQVRTASAS